ncbi:MAG: hypothetical protein ACTSRZ_11400 [Promethearchaeota archaeon]
MIKISKLNAQKLKIKDQINWLPEFTKEAQKFTLPEIGLRLLCTIDDRGWPHLTLISFNIAKTPNLVVWGQFTEGLSKKYVLKTKKQGILYMNEKPPLKFVLAKVLFDHFEEGGEDCERFSRGKLLRYMTYVNVYKAYYNKVIAATELQNYPLSAIIKGHLIQLISKSGLKSKGNNVEEKLNDFGYDLFNQMTSAKFIAYIDPSDGYPVIIPCFQLRAPDKSKLAFPYTPFRNYLEQIPLNAHVAVFGIVSENFESLNLMINGRLTKKVKSIGFDWGIIEIDEIYNSMPPLHGVIYPKLEVREKITDFPPYNP